MTWWWPGIRLRLGRTRTSPSPRAAFQTPWPLPVPSRRGPELGEVCPPAGLQILETKPREMSGQDHKFFTGGAHLRPRGSRPTTGWIDLDEEQKIHRRLFSRYFFKKIAPVPYLSGKFIKNTINFYKTLPCFSIPFHQVRDDHINSQDYTSTLQCRTLDDGGGGGGWCICPAQDGMDGKERGKIGTWSHKNDEHIKNNAYISHSK